MEPSKAHDLNEGQIEEKKAATGDSALSPEEKKKKEAPKTIVVKGVEYDAAFGKIVRAEDREQARINE